MIFFQIANIREEVEYYVEDNQDDNFQENEFIYDDLDLDELSQSLGAVLATSPSDENNFNLSGTPSTNSNSPSPSPGLSNHSKETLHHEAAAGSLRNKTKSESEDTRVSALPSIHTQFMYVSIKYF